MYVEDSERVQISEYHGVRTERGAAHRPTPPAIWRRRGATRRRLVTSYYVLTRPIGWRRASVLDVHVAIRPVRLRSPVRLIFIHVANSQARVVSCLQHPTVRQQRTGLSLLGQSSRNTQHVRARMHECMHACMHARTHARTQARTLSSDIIHSLHPNLRTY